MAVQDVIASHTVQAGSRIGVLRSALAGAVALSVLFVLCWIAAAGGLLNGSHMYLSLFTVSPVASVPALLTGMCWSVVFGGIAGALIALSYNAFAFLDRR